MIAPNFGTNRRRATTLPNDRFLVTGGAGFIGSGLVRHLAGLGASVRVVDNLVNGRRENIDDVLSSKVELAVAEIGPPCHRCFVMWMSSFTSPVLAFGIQFIRRSKMRK
jgi:NAD(P)-dependent dehydrogenase (short-subunit alcohol dehydrogenase family)